MKLVRSLIFIISLPIAIVMSLAIFPIYISWRFIKVGWEINERWNDSFDGWWRKSRY